ncbi:hypothetical protein HK098_002184 [Nowakowskiella sp. JEL0407]|nr:hypothetical protein HK098_002184 [Nowakowskiella sp. JEL0407]
MTFTLTPQPENSSSNSTSSSAIERSFILRDSDIYKVLRFWALSHVWGQVSEKVSEVVPWPVPINDTKSEWMLSEQRLRLVTDRWAQFLNVEKPPIWGDLYSANPKFRTPNMDTFLRVFSEAEVVIALVEYTEAEWLTATTKFYLSDFGPDDLALYTSLNLRYGGLDIRRNRLWTFLEDYLAAEVLYVNAHTGEPIVTRSHLFYLANRIAETQPEYHQKLCFDIGYTWKTNDPRDSHIKMLEMIKQTKCTVEEDREMFLSNVANLIAKKHFTSKSNLVSLPVIALRSDSETLRSFKGGIDSFGSSNFGGIYLTYDSNRNIGHNPVVTESYAENGEEYIVIDAVSTVRASKLFSAISTFNGILALLISLVVESTVFIAKRIPPLPAFSPFSYAIKILVNLFDLSPDFFKKFDFTNLFRSGSVLMVEMLQNPLFRTLLIGLFVLYLVSIAVFVSPFIWNTWISALFLPLTVFFKVDFLALFIYLLKYTVYDIKFELNHILVNLLLYALYGLQTLNSLTPSSPSSNSFYEHIFTQLIFPRSRIPQLLLFFRKGEAKTLYLFLTVIFLVNQNDRRTSMVMQFRTWSRTLLNNFVYIVRKGKWPVFVKGNVVVPHDAYISHIVSQDFYNNRSLSCCHVGDTLLYAWQEDRAAGGSVSAENYRKLMRVGG